MKAIKTHHICFLYKMVVSFDVAGGLQVICDSTVPEEVNVRVKRQMRYILIGQLKALKRASRQNKGHCLAIAIHGVINVV